MADGAEEHSTGVLDQDSTRGLYSNPTTNTRLQLLKRNTFHRNNKYLQRTIIQKGNDHNNEIINPKVEAPPHTDSNIVKGNTK